MTCVPYAAAHSAAKPSIAGCAAPNGSSAAAHRLRRQTVNRHIDPAWQGASPLRRRLAVATATTLRRPPHPLRCTGAAQHHLSPMRALSAKRLLSVACARGEKEHAVGAGRPILRRLRRGCSPAGAWRRTVAAFPLRAPSPKCLESYLNARPADAAVALLRSCSTTP